MFCHFIALSYSLSVFLLNLGIPELHVDFYNTLSWDRRKCRNVIYFMTLANTSKDHTVPFFCHNVALSQVQLFVHIVSPSFSQLLFCTMQFLVMFLLLQVFCFLPKCISSSNLYGILRLSPVNDFELDLSKILDFPHKSERGCAFFVCSVECEVILWLRFMFI